MKQIKYFIALVVLIPSFAFGSVSVTVNGSSHTIPQTNERGWGSAVTAWIQAISANTFQPTGGVFTLSADADFGASYGLKTSYLSTRTANPSGSGLLRLAKTDSIGWRNNANSGNLLLGIDASDNLTFNGDVVALATGTVTLTGTQTLTNKTLTAPVINSPTGIVKGDVGLGNVDNTSDATKNAASVTLTNKTIDADSNTISDIADANISSSAAIAYSKLNLGTSIVNADVSGSAAIALSKLAALGTAKALQSNASTGAIEVSSVTNTELGYVSGVTSAIQTQLDARVSKSTLTTKGDIFAASAASTPVRVGVGSDGTFLKADSTQTGGVVWASVAGTALAVTSKTTTYTATTADDVILVTTGSAWTLTLYAASGNSGKVLRVKKTSSDFNALTIDGNGSETIDGALTTSINTQYEEITLICDGSNWHILDRNIRSAWATYTPTYTGFGTVSPATNSAQWKRDGGDILINATVTLGTTAASLASISLPSGLALDTARIIATNTTSNPGQTWGFYGAEAANSSGNIVSATGTSTTVLYFGNTLIGTTELTPKNGSAILASSQLLNVQIRVPISGWEG